MSSLEVRFETLEAVGHAIGSTAPTEELLGLVIDMLLQAVPSEAATIFLKEPPDMLRFVVTRGPEKDLLQGTRIPGNQGIAGWVVEHDIPAIVADTSTDHRFSTNVDQSTGFKTASLLCVPLHTRRGAIGAIELINPIDSKFGNDESRYVTIIANQTAQLIDNVRLFQDRQHHLSMIKALQTASQWLNSSLHLETVLEKIVQTANDVIMAEAGSVLLVGENNRLDFTVALGPAADELIAKKDIISANLEDGIAGHVARTGEPRLISDCSKDPSFASGAGPKIKEEFGFETRSLLCVPMRARSEIVGVLEFINRLDGKPFDTVDVSTLSVFADDAAAALTNARLYESLEKSYLSTIALLATALDLRDNETGGHSQRVARMAREVALLLGLGKEKIYEVNQGSLLHDVGKIGIPDRILLKPGKLNEAEWKIMRRHTVIGHRLLAGIGFLDGPAVIPAFHHERFDGTGYMIGLKGEEIPLGARIFAVVDTYDAMTCDRPYRKAMPEADARKEMRDASGTQLDPAIVDVFLDMPMETIQEIRDATEEEVASGPPRKAEDGTEEDDLATALRAYERLKSSHQ